MLYVLFLFSFVGAARIRTSCDVSYYDHNGWGKLYTCNIKNILIEKPGTRVVSIKVNHLEDHGNADVKIVSIKREKTVYLPQGLSSFFPDIEELYVMHSELRHVTRQDFKGMKLTSISFYRNHIETIPYDALFDLTELKFLSFFSNKIEEIPLLLFRNLHKLESISFRFNKIESVPFYAFKNNKKLTSISLAYNKIVAFAAELILELPNLQSLLLSSNSCIDKDFYFESDNSKNETYETVLEFCNGDCHYENVLLVDSAEELKTCEDKVENEWKENEILKNF